MKRILFCAMAATALTSSVARADVVTEWNEAAVAALMAAKARPAAGTRALAMVHVAVFDAVNAVDHRYMSYHLNLVAPDDTSRRAAAAEAAHDVLVALLPSQASVLDARLADSLAAIAADPDHDGDGFSCFDPGREKRASSDDLAVANGVTVGRQVASDILAWRSTDHFRPNPFDPPFVGTNDPGVWRPTPTPPGVARCISGASPKEGEVTPFAMTSPSQFHPPGPPGLTSAAYANAVNEVHDVGAIDSGTRTAEQTEVARFWVDDSALLFNQAAATVSSARCTKHTRLVDNARAFALLNVAMADAFISCFEAKYSYVAWRPVTAIQLADTLAGTIFDNPGVQPDATWKTWTPLLSTPCHPDYTAAHAAVSSAGASALAALYGDANPFTLTSAFSPFPRTYSSFRAVSNEVNDARVWGGIHTRFAVDDGQFQGRQVAQNTLGTIMRPLADGETDDTVRSHDHGGGDCLGDGEIDSGQEP